MKKLALVLLLVLSAGCESWFDNGDLVVEDGKRSIRFSKTLSVSEIAVIRSDIERLRKLRLSTEDPIYRKYFNGPFSVERLEQWLYDRIGSFYKIRTSLPIIAYNGSAAEEKYNLRAKIGLSKRFFAIKSSIVRIAVLIHEARHTDGSVFDHTHCNVITYGGGSDGSKLAMELYGCDSGNDGSYGYEAVFLANVAKFCTDCTGSEKKEASNKARKTIIRYKSVTGDFYKLITGIDF